MITFLCGRESPEKSARVLEMIKESAAAGRRICVIVPEQQAVIWERRLARSLDPEISLGLDVVSFTRLANLAERRFGGLSYNYADRGARTLLMWKAVSAMAPLLKVYGSARNTANIVSAMQSAQTEFSRNGITPQMLSDAADVLYEDGETSLADRLHDLALVTAEYAAEFGEKYDDPGGEADKLLSLLREHDFFGGTDVFIDSFYSLTAVEADIAREIFSQAENTVMTFACPDRLPDGAPHLEHIHKFYVKMKESASRRGGFRIEEVTSANAENGDGAREYLRDNLWNFGAGKYEGAPEDYLTIINCDDRYDEAEAALCRVRELVQGGAKYSEIAIIARNTDKMKGIVDTAFAEAGVPLSVSVRYSLMDSTLIGFVFGVLGAVRSGYSRDDVCAVIKSGLTDISESEEASFCRYTQVWNISGVHAYTSGDWTMNPDGYSAEVTARGKLELELANSAKDKIEYILFPVTDAFSSGEADAEKILAALWETLSRAGAYGRLRDRADKLKALGYRDAAAFLHRSWDELMSAFNTFAEILGDVKTDCQSFSSLLRQVISARDVGVIPSGIDEVAFGGADRLRCDTVSHVIILGAVDGEFPRSPDESGIFTDADRIRLEGAGLTLSDSGEDRVSQELFWFWRACAMAESTLDIIIPETDGGKKSNPSSGVRRILELFPDVQCRSHSPRDPECALWRREDAPRFINYANDENAPAAQAIRMAALDAAVKEYAPPVWSSVTRETAERIFGKNVNTTQSRLDAFCKCRFAYYCRYVLGLDEREEKHLSPSDVGNFVHSVLEKFFSVPEVWELDAESMRDTVHSIVGEYVNNVFGTASSARLDYLTARLEKSVLLFCRSMSEEFAQSSFRPFALEQKIGMGEGSVPPYDIRLEDGSLTRVRGIIDRLDVMRKDGRAYIRVVDYKTGAKKLSEADIRLGLNTQLFLYLFAVWKCPPCDFRTCLLGGAEEIVPAGAMYFSAHPGETSSDTPVHGDEGERLAKASFSRSGKFLADGDVLRAMDRELKGEYIPVKELKDGTFTKNTVIPAEGFDELLETVTSALASNVGGMKKGKADALPLKHGGVLPCDTCPMMPVCRNTNGVCRIS